MRWAHHSVGLVLALTLVCASSQEAGVSVRNAWIREAPLGATMLAGYMELRNSTSQPQVLAAAGSPGFESVRIHRTIVKNGMTGMVHAPQVELAPNSSLIFSPGGYHLMLLNPKQTLRTGEPIVVNLQFRDGLVLPVAFEVRK